MDTADCHQTDTAAQRLDHFWQHLSESAYAALLLDYDGTLAPFRVARDQAVPYPGVREQLEQIHRDTATRLVIISGRSVRDLLPLLGLIPPPEIWGCHGREHLAEGDVVPELDLPEAAGEGLQQAKAWINAAQLGDRCEIKPASLAIHWRGLPEAESRSLKNRVSEGWQPFVRSAGLELHSFDGGLELRCPGKDKGSAITTVLSELPHDCPVAFLGDDLTDEDGFAAIAGQGLGVLVRTEPRPTRACLRLSPPEALLEFLTTWWRTAPRPGIRPAGEQS